MKYIIASKGYVDGLQQCSGQSQYTELGYELIISYMYIKHLINTHQLTQDDVIVTKKDREFLYQQDHPNVINFDDYLKLSPPKEDIIDLVELLISDPSLSWLAENYNKETYKYKVEDYNLIRSFKKSNITIPDEPYACLAIRKRAGANWRDTPDMFASIVINDIKPLFKKIFIFGNNIESFCDFNITFPIILQDFATLSENKNCAICISHVSGIIYIPYIFSNAKSIHMVSNQYSQLMTDMNNGNPMWFSKNTYFAPSKYYVYDIYNPNCINVLVSNIIKL